MKKNTKHGFVTGLTALSTAIICQTSATYASDIEIYKAPTTGGAIIQLILDASSSMRTPVNGASGGYQNPINKDFGITCNTNESNGANQAGRTYIREINKQFIDSNNVAHSYTIDGRYCNVRQTDVNGYNATKRNLIIKSCELFTSTGTSKTNYYRCPDRLTSLQLSIFDLIVGTPSVERLPDTTLIGITTFPTYQKQEPIRLDDNGRKIILEMVADLSVANGTPISRAYATAIGDLLTFSGRSTEQCAGYGAYFLTDGEPQSDDRGAARTTINPYLKSTSQITTTQCNGTNTSKNSWSCVEAISDHLYNKNSKAGLEIKTAIVGFGGDFSFKDSSGNIVSYSPGLTLTQAENLFTGDYQKAAARAAVAGQGGWFSADNTADIVYSVQNFVESVKVPIPAITTGVAATPQDTLNPIVIQPYAYFPQFQPKPAEDFETWFGNLKKYKVVGGVLKGQNAVDVFNANAGSLNTAVSDYWVQGATSTELTTLGGMLSKLKLQANAANTAFQRTVYTNQGGEIQEVDEAFLKANIASNNNKYLLGILGYDLTEQQLNELAAKGSGFAINDPILAGKTPVRHIGSVMHSTPVLLTQAGQITYDTASKTNVTVDREDYILFGTTQGALHVVKTGRETETYPTGTTVPAYTGGEEVFTFVPNEILTSQPHTLLAEDKTVGEGMDDFKYGVDGAWTAHTEYVYDTSSNKFTVFASETNKGKQWVYGGMRMGGKSYYALDLTDINKPKVKFRIDPVQGKIFKGDDTTGVAVSALSNMGQSWSKPTIAHVQWKGKRKLVMIVGGGYDEGYESLAHDPTSSEGAGVFMFDADTGDLLWSTQDIPTGNQSVVATDKQHIKFSVVSQIKTVDREGDGDIDHLYFGDLGGQVFRIDLNSAHASDQASTNFVTKVQRILNLREAGKIAPRFYEMPAFSVYRQSGKQQFAVLTIGSGNRSNPLVGKMIDGNFLLPEDTTNNTKLLKDAIYNIYDLEVTTRDPAASTLGPVSATRANLQKITNDEREAKAGSVATKDYDETTAYKGWYYEFDSPNGSGRNAVEKVQGDLILIDSDLYATTFDAEGVGETEACGAGIYGSSRAHRFCMPYGQCVNETVTANTLDLGKGLLGITLGDFAVNGSTEDKRGILAPVQSRPSDNKILNTLYGDQIRLTPFSWYERR